MGIKLDGKFLANNICQNLATRCDHLKECGIEPALTIVTTGDDAASQSYAKAKIARCKEIGVFSIVKHYDYLTKAAFIGLLSFTKSPIIIQEPIVGDVDYDFINVRLDPWEDVDGACCENMGRLAVGFEPLNAPCTPMGVMRLLDEYMIDVEGKNALVIGRSNIVGRPMAMMLEHAGATVTIAHSKTKSLLPLMNKADIIVSATGHRMTDLERDVEMYCKVSVDDRRFKTIIDVGINRDENGKLCGDFSEEFKAKYGYWTPSAGGVGPMTTAMLMENVIRFYERDM